MSDRSYADFDIAIEHVDGDTYRCRVLDSPTGQARAEFAFPFSPLELENFMLRIGRPRGGVRRIESPEMEAARAFGEKLYKAVFSGEVGMQWQRSMDAAERDEQGLRLRLRLADAPQLNDVPWEYLYSDSSDRFLVLSSWTPLVRYMSLDRPAPPLKVAPPLRMIAMISSPNDYPPLDTAKEWARLQESLGEVIEAGLIEITLLEDATLRELQGVLRRSEFHVFHFIGHGGFDEAAQDGVLVLENDQGRARQVTGRDLGTILYDSRTIRLAVLNACEGARTSAQDPFAGAAQSLVLKGIPAVVAMQFEISDSAAIILAHEFYAALTDGMPVDAALAEARRAIFGSGSDVEWGTPVLHMRSEDGKLFDIAATPRTTPKPEAPIIEDASPVASPVVDVEEPVVDEPSPAPSRQTPEPVAEKPEPAVPVSVVPVAAEPEPTREVQSATITESTQQAVTSDAASADGQSLGDRVAALPMWSKVAAGVGTAAAVAIIAIAVSGGPTTDTTVDTTLGTTVATTVATTGVTTSTVVSTTVVETVVETSEVVEAVPLPESVTIDGSLEDWVSVSRSFAMPHTIFTDTSAGRLGTPNTGTIRLAYDIEALYVAAEIIDDVYSQANEGNQIWRGDAVNINLSSADVSNISARPDLDDFQLTMTPLSQLTGSPGFVWFVGSPERESFFDNSTELPVTVLGVVDGPGYTLEARIPWSVFGLSAPPGRDLAAIVTVFDNDGEGVSDGAPRQAEIQANVAGAGFQDPILWGRITFTD